MAENIEGYLARRLAAAAAARLAAPLSRPAAA